MSQLLSKIGIVLLLVIAFVFSVVYIFFNTIRKAEPDYNGTIACQNLQRNVQIYFDSTAIPYIYADSEEDAAYSLGYLHARERLFQMDLARRSAEGKLSAIFGEKTVSFDEMFISLGIRRTAEKMYAAAQEPTKKILTAYSNGVNEYISTHNKNLPIEFDALGYEPERWTPVNSMEVIRMMSWELNIAWWADFAYAQITQKLGVEKASKLLPDYPENDPLIIPRNMASLSAGDLKLLKTSREYRKFFSESGTHIGSNNWTVTGTKTKSGKPIIANDPHLSFMAPGKWYFCCIRGGEWNAEGVTIPGVPVVVIGKNRDISWTMTNAMADETDFYKDSLDASLSNYYFDGEWVKLQKYDDTIFVKDSQPVVFETSLTHRGAIISGTHPFPKLFEKSKVVSRSISMSWTGNIVSDELSSFLQINKAKNWRDFKSALSTFATPCQNFVYADAKGNIGYILGGKIPVRRTQSPQFISDGRYSESDWKGFVPLDEMPEMYNPSIDYIATANNKVQSSFPYYISNLWEPSSRIKRIKEVLESKEKINAEDCEVLQMDTKSLYAKEVVPYLLEAFEGLKIKDENLKLSLNLLSHWTYDFDKEKQAPAIYAMFFDCLLQNTLRDDLGDELYNEYCFVPNIPYRVMSRLLKDNEKSIFDNLNTPQYETRGDILRKSLVDALAKLEKTFGKEVLKWQWGSLHKVTFKHPLHGSSSVIDYALDIGPFPVGGDGTTVCNGEYNFYNLDGDYNMFKSDKFENILGASMRFIYDYSDPDVIKFSAPTGQSGISTGEHYKDLTENYLQGKYLRIKIDEASAKKNSNKIELIPR